MALRAPALFRGHPAAAGARPLPARRLRPRPAPRASSPPVRGSGYIGPSGRLRRFPPGPLVALRPVGRSAGSRPPSAPCSLVGRSARLPPGLLGRGSSGPGGRSPRGGRWPGWLRWPGCAPWSASPRAARRPAFCSRLAPGVLSPCGAGGLVALASVRYTPHRRPGRRVLRSRLTFQNMSNRQVNATCRRGRKGRPKGRPPLS